MDPRNQQLTGGQGLRCVNRRPCSGPQNDDTKRRAVSLRHLSFLWTTLVVHVE